MILYKKSKEPIIKYLFQLNESNSEFIMPIRIIIYKKLNYSKGEI